MEEGSEARSKETTENMSSGANVENQTSKATGDVNVEIQTSKATGDVSSTSEGISGIDSHRPDGAEPRKHNRLLLFNKVMEKSLQKFIADANFQRFARTFHPFYKKNPKVTENIHKQFIEQLQRAIQDDINNVIKEGELQCQLDKLDKLEGSVMGSSDPAWRPSGVPEQDLCSFVMPYYQKQEAYLRKELKKIQKENAALAQRVQAGREGIAQAEQRIAATVDEWKASASSLCPRDTFDV